MATRARLHGMKWPSTNSKFLAVDFLTPEDVSRISEGQLDVSKLTEGEPSKATGTDETEAVEAAAEKVETTSVKQEGKFFLYKPSNN